MTRLQLSQPQLDFIQSNKKVVAYVGGIGSGKTWVLCLWVIKTALKYPKAMGLICANTYTQLSSATLLTLETLLIQLNIPYTRSGNKKGMGIVFNINGGADIFCRSLEKPDSIRGIEAGWLGIDEAAFASEYSYEVVLGRLRDKNGNLQIRISTSPNGFNWVYDLVVTDADETTKLIQGKSTDNKNLPADYIKSLRKQYDPKMLEQEMGGAFINTSSGQTYYAFDRFNRNIVQPWSKPLPSDLLIGIDFNVNPLCAVVFVDTGSTLHAVDEFYLKDSNTFELRDSILERYPDKRIAFVADATGKARKTSASKSDLQILREAGFVSLTPKSNPLQKDRFNAVNGGFHHGKILVSPTCKYLIKDLEQVTHEDFKAGGNPELTHISDAFGYPVHKKFAIRKPAKTSRVL